MFFAFLILHKHHYSLKPAAFMKHLILIAAATVIAGSVPQQGYTQQQGKNRTEQQHMQRKDTSDRDQKNRKKDKDSSRRKRSEEKDRKMDNYKSNQPNNSSPSEQQHMDSTINKHR